MEQSGSRVLIPLSFSAKFIERYAERIGKAQGV
jgi:hypothetical protein